MLSTLRGPANGAEVNGYTVQAQNVEHLLNKMRGFPVSAIAMRQYNQARGLANKAGRKGTLGAVVAKALPGAFFLAVDRNNGIWVSVNNNAGGQGNGVTKLDTSLNVVTSAATTNGNNSGGGPIAVDSALDVGMGNSDNLATFITNNLQSMNTANPATFIGGIAAQNVQPTPRFVVTYSTNTVAFLTSTGLTTVGAAVNMTVSNRSVAVDPTDNSIWVAGNVNAGGNQATLLHLSADGANLLETIAVGATQAAADFWPQGLVVNSQGIVFVGAVPNGNPSLPGLVKVSGTQGARVLTPLPLVHENNTTFVAGCRSCRVHHPITGLRGSALLGRRRNRTAALRPNDRWVAFPVPAAPPPVVTGRGHGTWSQERRRSTRTVPEERPAPSLARHAMSGPSQT